MGMFDWVKQLENGAGQLWGDVSGAVGGAVQGAENAIGGAVQGAEHFFNQPAAPSQPSSPPVWQQVLNNLSHAGGDALHGNLGGAFNDLLAKYGEQNKPAPAPAKPLFNIAPVADYVSHLMNPTTTVPTLAKTALNVADHIPTPISGGAPGQPNLSVGEIARQLPQATADTAVNLAHGIADVAPKLAVQGADMLDPGNTHTFQATDPVGKFIFGSDPVTSYQNQAEQFSQWAKDHGVDPTAANALSIPAAGVMAAMDLFGGGKGKAATDAIAKEATATGVNKILESYLGKESASKIPQAALDAMAAEKNPAKIADIMKGHLPSPQAAEAVATGTPINPAEVSPHLQAAQALMADTGKSADALKADIVGHKESLVRNELGNMLTELKQGTVTQGTLNRTADGTVVGRNGRFSTNPEWYKVLHRGQADTGLSVSKKGIESAVANARPNSKLYTALRTVAEDRLRGNYNDPIAGAMPHNPAFVGAERVLKGIDEHQALPVPKSTDMQKWEALGGKPEEFPFKTTEEMSAEGRMAGTTKPGRAAHQGNELTPGLHEPLPIRNTPSTPSLSAEHMDIPGKAPLDIKRARIKLAPPKDEKALVKGFGSIKTVIGRQGQAGKELVGRMLNVRHTHEALGQAFHNAIPTVHKLSNGRDMPNFVDVIEGKAAPINKKVAQAVTEWQGLAKRIEGRALESGIHMGHIEDYFPHMFDKKFFSDKKTYNQAIEHLVNTGQASDIQNAVQMLNDMREPWQGGHRFGNLEKARNADIPGYRTDKGVIRSYIDKSARRIAEADQFGKDNEHVDRLFGQMAKEGKDANAAQEHFNAYFNPAKAGAISKAAGGVRKGTSYLTLSKAAISHSTQTSNTAIVTGITRTAHAWLSRLGNKSEVEWAKSIGINYDGHAGQRISGIAPGLKQMRAQNRIVSAIAGKRFGDALARRGKIDQLKNKWGVPGEIKKGPNGRYVLSPDQQAHMGHAIADATQFSDDAMDSPAFARTTAGKLMGQYRMSYQYKQGGFLYDQILKEAGRGNLVPLLRAAAVIPVAGAAVIEAKHLLGSKTDTSDPVAVAEAGGLGTVPTALIGSAKYMYDGKSAAKTIAGDIAPAAGMAVETGQNIADALNGNTKPIAKQALGYIPFIGAAVKNAAYPSTPADPSAIAYVQGETAGRKALTSSKDQGVWDALYGSNKDSAGNKIPSVYDPNNSPFVAEALLAHPNVLAAATKFYQDFAAKTGQAIDPVYNLPPDQQIAALNIRAAAAFPGELSADKKQLATQLPADYRAQQDAYYNSVSASLAAAGKDTGALPGAPQYPTASASVQALMDAGNTKDPAVQAYFDQISAYNNQKRGLMGLPEIAAYGFGPSGSQIPNPSNPYAKKLVAGTSANPTFASAGGSGGSGGKRASSGRAKGAGSRGGKIAFPKGRTVAIKATKVKLAKAPSIKATKMSVTKVAKIKAYKMPKVKLA